MVAGESTMVAEKSTMVAGDSTMVAGESTMQVMPAKCHVHNNHMYVYILPTTKLARDNKVTINGQEDYLILPLY